MIETYGWHSFYFRITNYFIPQVLWIPGIFSITSDDSFGTPFPVPPLSWRVRDDNIAIEVTGGLRRPKRTDVESGKLTSKTCREH